MNLMERMVDGFILTMGITRRRSGNGGIATIFIASGVILSVLAVLGFFVVVLSRVAGR